MRNRAVRYWLGIVALSVSVALLAAGCAPRPPRAEPDFPAVVVRSVSANDSGYGSVLVESTASGKASINVTADTKVLREVGGAYERAAFSDIAVGQTLDVWTTGQVAESYPVQAWATAVVIRTAK
jgi:hypothetical protein